MRRMRPRLPNTSWTSRGRAGSGLLVKGKSMLSEEMGLNGHLERAGIEPVETDLGEYLIQLRGETPYHIIAPAVHLSQDQVSDLLQERAWRAALRARGGADRRRPRRASRQVHRGRHGYHGREFPGRRDGHAGARDQRGQRQDVHVDAPRPRGHHGHGEGRPVDGGHGDVPAAPDQVGDGPAPLQLRDDGERTPARRRRGRPGGVPPRDRGQRAVEDARRPRACARRSTA